jgi:hypothetical protein
MPRMPDTRIPLSGLGGSGAQQGGGFNPMQTLGSLMQIKEQQLVYQQRQREAEKAQRDQEDEDAMRYTLQRHERPDEAIQDLWSQGRGVVASKLAASVYGERKARFDAQAAEQKATADQLEMASQIVSGITDEASLKVARPALIRLARPMIGDAVEDLIPTTYAGNEARLKQLGTMGQQRAQQLTEQHNLTMETIAKYTAGMERAAPRPDPKTGELQPGNLSDAGLKMQDAYRDYLTRSLTTVDNQQDWDRTLQTAWSNGAPVEVLKDYAWDPDPNRRQQKLYKRGLTIPQEVNAANAAVRAETAQDREERLARGGTGGLTPAGRGVAVRARDTENRAIDKWVRSAFDTDNPADREKGPDGKLKTDAAGHPLPIKKKPFRVEDLSENNKQEFVQRRLQNENNYRNQIGMPPLEDAAAAAAQRGDVAGYEKVRDIYNSLTQNLTLLEDLVPPPPGARPARGARATASATPNQQAKTRLQAIYAQLKTERNPRTIQALQAEQDALVAALR